jgi:threonine synthase
VGLGAATHHHDGAIPMVCLATADPAKFPDAVEAACGVRPELPEHLADLFVRHERFVRLPNDLAVVEEHVASTRMKG